MRLILADMEENIYFLTYIFLREQLMFSAAACFTV